MRPLYLKLRNFRAIRSGLGVDELELDLSHKPKGLINLLGDIGRGKSTILGNLHPYRLMPDKVKTYSPRAMDYYYQCFGRDACKEFRFSIDSTEYKSLLMIDAEKRECEAYLYQKSGEEWRVYGNTDGKLAVYDTAVEELCGSPQLFFTYIHQSQKAPALSSYTRGEMMELFTEMLCIQTLREKADNARLIRSELLKKLEGLQDERRKFEADLSGEERKKEEQTATKARLAELAAEFSRTENRLQEAETALRGFELQVSLQEEATKKRAKLEEALEECNNEIHDLRTVLTSKKEHYNQRYSSVKTKALGLEALLKKEEDLQAKARREQGKASEADVLKAQALHLDEQYVEKGKYLSRYGVIADKLRVKEQALQKLQLGRKHSIESAEKELKSALEAEIELQNLAEIPCGGQGEARSCKFLQKALRLKDSIPALRAQLAQANHPSPEEAPLTKSIAFLTEELKGKADLEKELVHLEAEKRSLHKKLSALEVELKGLRVDLLELPKVEEARKTLPELEKELESIYDEAIKVIAEVTENIKKKEKEVEKLNEEIKGVTVDSSLSAARDKASKEIDLLKKSMKDLREEESRLQVALGSIEEALRGIGKAKEECGALTAQITVLEKDISEWALLEKGMEGIITLEIDDAGPAVTSITNDILHTCYGPRYSVNIRTQAEKSNGRDLKEVFDILVIDAERGETKSLADVSGGEETYIEDAISKGAALFNKQKSGKTYHFLFADEMDGSLSAKRRPDFVSVKRRVIELGGFDGEFYISHSPEVQAMADETIDLEQMAKEFTAGPLLPTDHSVPAEEATAQSEELLFR